jgi:hypothetical protein
VERSLEEILKGVPPPEWATEQAIIFDWYDGPREGICALSNPKACFAFRLLAERPTEDDLDDRLFSLSSIPDATVAEVINLLSPLGEPTKPVWVPMWKFPNQSTQDAVEDKLDALLAAQRLTKLIVYTRDMKNFLGCWEKDAGDLGVKDWFSALAI